MIPFLTTSSTKLVNVFFRILISCALRPRCFSNAASASSRFAYSIAISSAAFAINNATLSLKLSLTALKANATAAGPQSPPFL